jgi:peptidoglycan/LPS O-acetylase OafA/YrhL
MTVPEKSASYRPDVDGLRAVAVLAVIVYHFNAAWLPGGFTGVDIFFVISGYFIIGIIMRELRDGKFSLVEFWERRVRRIAPAMIVVLGGVTVASYYVLLIPNDFVNFGHSLMAQSVSVSNWWFMRESGYFAAPVDSVPLLHTWTLSVEEQFYILFPLLALFIYPYTKSKFRLLMIGITMVSFLYSVMLVNVSPSNQFSIPLVPHLWGSASNGSAGFYFIASRFWELLLGGSIAVYAIHVSSRWLSELLAFGGLGAIAAGFLYITNTTPFPGILALLPVLGTAALIVGNTHHSTIMRKALSFPVLVYIGLISYSLYLWHWPLLVLSRYQLNSQTTLSTQDQVLLLIAIFVLSALTYHFVENPIRKKRFLANRDHLFLVALTGIALLFAAGFVISAGKGYPSRVPLEARNIALTMGEINPRQAECFTRSLIGVPNDKPCLLGMQDPANIDYVLWGDCHANIDIPAFDEFGRRTNRTGIFFGSSACPPFLTEKPLTKDPRCIDELKKFAAYMQAHPTAELFIASEWERAYKYTNYTEGSNNFSPLAPLMHETLSKLPKETKITILLRTQTFPETTFHDMFFRLARGEKLPMSMPRHIWESSLESFHAGIREVAPHFPNVRVLNPSDTFCRGDFCYIADDNGFYYADASHLSEYGVMQNILPLLLAADSSSR